MVWKAKGSVWNTSVGPAAGSSPTAKTIGKIIKPASSATPISAKAINAEVEPNALPSLM